MKEKDLKYFNDIAAKICIPENLFTDKFGISGKTLLNNIKSKNKNKVTLLKILEDSTIFPLNIDEECVIFEKYKKECIKNSVGSHTISCSQNLEPIASIKDKKVYQVNGGDSYYSQAKNKGQYFSIIPISKASVFPGFCCKHESLFSNIDHGLNILNDDDIYWAYYREIMFYFLKLQNNVTRGKYLYNLFDKLKTQSFIKKEEYDIIDRISLAFYNECVIENKRKNECLKIINKLNDNIDINKNINKDLLYIKHFEYEGKLPFTLSGLFNTDLNNIDDSKSAFYITVTINNKGNSLITLSCFLDNEKAIREIDKISSQKSILNTVFKLSFSMENCYYNIDFINKDKDAKERMQEYFNKDTFLRFNAPYSEEYIEHFKNILEPFNFIKIDNKLINSY